jgi:hypothetical protein
MIYNEILKDTLRKESTFFIWKINYYFLKGGDGLAPMPEGIAPRWGYDLNP